MAGSPRNPLFENGREIVLLEGINTVTLHDRVDTLTGQHLELMLKNNINDIIVSLYNGIALENTHRHSSPALHRTHQERQREV